MQLRRARRGRRSSAWVAAVTLALVAATATGCNNSTPSGSPTSASTSSSAAANTGSNPGTSGTAPSTPGTTRGTTPPATDDLPADDGPVDPIQWKPCDGPFECGTLAVPLDYADPRGSSIDLAVVRRPATNAATRIGSIMVNPGGPGASGVDFVKAGAPGRALSGAFDIVSWDPRGVGASSPVVCNADAPAYRDLDWSPDTADERTDLDDAARAIAEDCERKAGPMLAHVATDDTARDLDRLRRAVGDEKLTYLGFSYGTYIAERYAELFPTRVRAMVLDGVVDPTATLDELLLGQAEALEKQMDELFDSCETRPSCPINDAAAAYDELAERVETAPMGTGVHQFGPTALAFAAVSSSYRPDSGDDFLAGIEEALDGDHATLQGIANDYFTSSSYSSYLAVLCTDTPRPTNGDEYTALAKRLQKASPRFGEAIANEVRPCAFWKAPAVEPTDPVHALGSPPILVVGNTGDVATPYDDAVKVAADLDQGVLLTFNGSGHTSYGKSACVDAAVNAYLISLTVPDAGTECD